MVEKWEYVLGGFIIAIVAFVLIGYVFESKDDKNPNLKTMEQRNPYVQEPAVTKTEPEPELVAQGTDTPKKLFDWTNAEVTEENVREALKDRVGAAMSIPLTDDRFRKFVSSADTNGEYVEITLNPGTFYDYKDFVKKAGGSLIAYSKVLFENPQVYEISLNVLIDNIGGGENEGVYISWRRDQIEDIDFDIVLDSMFGDYTIPYQLARKYNIQKDIYNELEEFELPSSSNL